MSHDDIATAKLPWFSKAILHLSDFGSISSARRRNYRVLDEHLEENSYLHKVLPPLPDNVCPWAYPVWLNDRGKYDRRLRSLGIPVFTFGDVLHPLLYKSDDKVVAPANALAKNLLMIPIHQNLNEDAILSFCRTINNFFHNLDETKVQP